MDLFPIPGPDGNAIGIGVNLAGAPVPDRHYVADVASVYRKDDVLRLLFGQEKLSSGLRSLLVVKMSTAAVRQLVSSVTEMKEPSLDEIAGNLGIKPAALTEITEEPEQTVAFPSNLAAVAVSGGDACLDFFQASPFALNTARATNSSRLGIDPVVRVDIRTSLLIAMVNKLRELQKDFPPDEIVG